MPSKRNLEGDRDGPDWGPAGYGALHQIESKSYYISAVAVYPEFRGGGIGRHLIAAAASDAQRLGSPQLSLLSFEQNELATPLYQRLNFEVTGRSRGRMAPVVTISCRVMRWEKFGTISAVYSSATQSKITNASPPAM